MEARRKGYDGWRVPAAQLESIVEQHLTLILSNEAQLADWIQEAGLGNRMAEILAEATRIRGRYEFESRDEKRRLLRAIVMRVELRPTTLVIDVDRQALLDLVRDFGTEERSKGSPDHRLMPIQWSASIAIKRRGVETRMVLLNGVASASQNDPALIQLIARAHIGPRQGFAPNPHTWTASVA